VRGDCVSEQKKGISRQREALDLLKWLAAVIAIAGLLAWVGWRAWQDAQQVEWEGLRIRPGLVALSMACLAGAFFFHGLLWVRMMRGLGYRLGWVAGMRACVLSQLGNYVPGKVLMMVFRAQVVRQHGLPGWPVASSVVLETVLRNLVAAVVVALGLLELGSRLGETYGVALVAFVIVSATVAHPSVFQRLVGYLLRRLGREPLPRRLSWLDTGLLLAGYFAYWALYVQGFRLLTLGTMGGEDAPGYALAVSLLLAQLASTLAVFAPVGLGVADATLEAMLRLTGAVSAPGVLALVTRLWRTVTELAAIGLAWVLGAGSGAHGPSAGEKR